MPRCLEAELFAKVFISRGGDFPALHQQRVEELHLTELPLYDGRMRMILLSLAFL